MKNATPKLPLFSFFMFLFEKTPIRPRTSFLSGQKMPPCPGSWLGLPCLQSRKKRRKPLQLIFLCFTNRLRIWPKVTDESKKIDKHHRAPVDFLVGLAGFEPTDAGVKVPCLTAWRQPSKNAVFTAG